jgi:hypothetical protein
VVSIVRTLLELKRVPTATKAATPTMTTMVLTVIVIFKGLRYDL